MSTYNAAWAPRSLSEAIWQITPPAWSAQGDETAFWQSGRDVAARLAPYLPPEPGTVLDYGCGVGRVLRYLPGVDRVGVDASERMLALARDLPENAGITFRLTDGRSIPAETASVDFVYSIITLQHMDADDVRAVVVDTARVLSARGRYYLLFSGFGDHVFRPGATLNRHGAYWWGDPQHAACPAHQVLRYAAEDVAGLAREAGLAEATVQEEHWRPHLYWALIGGQR